MPSTILGLDIGGANLKAATPDKRAASVPFPLWKQPDKLPAALAELVARFPDADELAVTMTGELCDCFETKRDGVHAIIAAVRGASAGRRIRVWSTDGAFMDSEEAKRNHLKVAAANWHALATFAGQYVPNGRAVLIDVGSTTTDIIPLLDGVPIPTALTDTDRLRSQELVYTGVSRTPVCAVLAARVAAELFATMLDVYIVLNLLPEQPGNNDTADGRPATRVCASDRLCRMICGDRDTVSPEEVEALAADAFHYQRGFISKAFDRSWETTGDQLIARGRSSDLAEGRVVVCGLGEFLARHVVDSWRHLKNSISLTDRLGPDVSACAPAYAVAVLATEAEARFKGLPNLARLARQGQPPNSPGDAS